MNESETNVANVEAAYYAHLTQEIGRRIATEAARAGGWSAFYEAKIIEAKARAK